jgi:hypothetical protein
VRVGKYLEGIHIPALKNPGARVLVVLEAILLDGCFLAL